MPGHPKDAWQLGGELVSALAETLAHNKTFLNALQQGKPTTVEGTVTAVHRDGTGLNAVTLRRTGQSHSDATQYIVWSPMHVPIVGDVLRLMLIGKGAAIVLGAKHGGRPNEHTIAYTGGAHHHYDSSRNHIHKHGDDHHHRHYRTDGATIAHHHHEAGHHGHTGNHRMGGGAGLVLADDGTPSGTWHEKAHNNSRYEHSQSGTLVRHHNVSGDHGHYTNGVLHHQIVAVGTAGGQVKLRQHNASAYHVHGDDGTGKVHILHASGNRAYDHDGTTVQHYSGGSVAQRSDNHTHRFFDVGINSITEAVRLTTLHTFDGTGGDGGTLGLKVASGTAYHSAADEGGTLRVRSQGSYLYHDVNGGTARHSLNAYAHTFPQAHVVGDDGTGKVHVQHGSSGTKSWDHDGTTHQHYSGGTAVHKVVGVGTAGGQVQIKQHGTSAYHLHGDDGTGKVHIQHASGNRSWDHDGATHQHYGSGQLLHQIVSVGTAGGQVRLKQHNTGTYHHVGDDGGGVIYLQHGNGLRAMEHDGTNYVHFCGGNSAMASLLGVIGTNIYSHHFYHTYASPADTELVCLDIAGTTGNTGGGRARFKQYGTTNPASSSSIHLVGDDGVGNMHASSMSGTHYTYLSNYTGGHHGHTAGSHSYPTGAFHNAPVADSSRLDSIGAGGAGGIKKPSHSYTAGTQDYAWTIGTGAAGTSGPQLGANGTSTDPHLKFVATNTWEGSNSGFYVHPTPTPFNFSSNLNAAVVGWGHPVSTGAGTWDYNTAYHCVHMDADASNYVCGKSTASTAVHTTFLWSVVNS